MLQLRPSCECCDRALPPDSPDARICSFECTFCEHCATAVLHGRCPNCGGELVVRPRRPAAKLAKYPPVTSVNVVEIGFVMGGTDQAAFAFGAASLGGSSASAGSASVSSVR
jgi:hypothetical protein